MKSGFYRRAPEASGEHSGRQGSFRPICTTERTNKRLLTKDTVLDRDSIERNFYRT